MFEDRLVERPLTYITQNNEDGSITLIPSPGKVFQEGTKVDAQHLNKLVVSDIQKTLLANAWVGETAPYTQEILISALTESMVPIISLVYSTSNLETMQAEDEGYSQITRFDVANGKIVAKCFEDKPEVDITVNVKGWGYDGTSN